MYIPIPLGDNSVSIHMAEVCQVIYDINFSEFDDVGVGGITL